MRYIQLPIAILSVLLASSLAGRTPPVDTGLYKCENIPGTAKRCSIEFTGACAYFTKPGDSKTLYQKYTANGCIACNDPDAKFWEMGKCKGNTVYCGEDFRPQVCTEDYTPVCAYSTNEDGNQEQRTAGNDCSACADPSVTYFVRGECPSNLRSPTK